MTSQLKVTLSLMLNGTYCVLGATVVISEGGVAVMREGDQELRTLAHRAR